MTNKQIIIWASEKHISPGVLRVLSCLRGDLRVWIGKTTLFLKIGRETKGRQI